MTDKPSSDKSPIPEDNRRKFQRKAIRHDLMVGVEGVDHRLEMTDLSAGGAFIETDLPLKPGTDLQLVLQHYAYHGSARARIMWGNSSGFGIAFSHAGQDFNETVDAILTHRLE